MANTTNFGWETPDDTDLVKDGAAAMRTLGSAIDTSMMDLKGGTSGQILSKNSNTDMDFVWITNDVGDITSVVAGVGMTGGGTSGAVTLTNDMASTITAAGDIVVGTGSGTYDNLPIGTTGQVLTADTTVSPYKVKWATASSSPSFVGVGLNKTSDQSISNDTSTAITYTGEDFDTDGFHSTVTNTSRITIPAGKGGYYYIYAYLSFQDNATGSRAIHINKNGSRIATFTRVQTVTESGATTTIGGTMVFNLAATDYIEVLGYQKSGGSLNVLGSASPDDWRSRFGAYFIGA
jgi:hypothetical protein